MVGLTGSYLEMAWWKVFSVPVTKSTRFGLPGTPATGQVDSLISQ
jgi:hypothetical protein